MSHGDRAPGATALGVLLGAAVVGFWAVDALYSKPPWRAPFYSDSIPTPASSAELPPVPPRGTRIRVGFVGDLMQHREQKHDDFRRSYALVAPHLRALDLAVGNLEFPVDSTLPAGPDPGTVRFNGCTAHLDAIADAGFDVLQTANNHSADRGLDGLLRTLVAVRSRGMRPVGTAESVEALRTEPVLVDAKGVRIAFRAYTMPLNYYLDGRGRPQWAPRDLPVDALDFEHWREDDRDHGQALFREHVAQARAAGAEVLVAMVHWGREYYLAPSADQQRAAHDLIDAGFDLVIGTHPHVLEPSEVYRGKLIAFSLGNFVARSTNPATAVGAVLEVELAKVDGRTVLADFGYRVTQARVPGHVITPVDSARGPEDAAAWVIARRALGPALAPWTPVPAPAGTGSGSPLSCPAGVREEGE